MQERRNLERRDLVYYLRAFDRSKDQLLGYVANISTEGVMLIGEKPIEPNATFDLKMLLPVEIAGKGHVEFRARSTWCRKDGSNGFLHTGFQLSNIALDDREAIRQICSDPAIQSRQALTAKRVFDILASFLGLLLLSPIFLLIGLVIRLGSPGSVYFAAERVGIRGRLFLMYKFRTMTEWPGGNGPMVHA